MTDLILLNPDAEQADIFFGQQPQFTDWSYYLQHPDCIRKEALVEEIGHKEPVAISSPDMPRLFVIQQMLRIALRRDKKLPLVTTTTCSCCGSRYTDPALKTCLNCHEENFLIGDNLLHGYGSSHYTVMYDPGIDKWGLHFSSGYRRDGKYVMWAATGYARRLDARLAFYPAVLFNQWVRRKTKGMASVSVPGLIGLDILMSKGLPLQPDEFEKLLKEKIGEQMNEKFDLFGGNIRWAIDEYESKHRK